MRTRSTERFRTSAPLHSCHGCKPLPFTVPRLVWVSLIIAGCTVDWQFWANTTRTVLPDSWNIVPGRKTFSPFQFIWSSSNSMVATSEDQRYQMELKASGCRIACSFALYIQHHRLNKWWTCWVSPTHRTPRSIPTKRILAMAFQSASLKSAQIMCQSQQLFPSSFYLISC